MTSHTQYLSNSVRHPSTTCTLAFSLSLACATALTIPACTQPGSPHGWTCELRPTRLHRDSATPNLHTGPGTIPGMELHCTQR